jgi:hypothetical protein
MGSVSAVNPGVADLLQALSSLNSPALSSPGVTSALENAPATDIVQLSMAAIQLEGVDTMFGISNSSSTGASSAAANLGDLLTASVQAASTAPAAATAQSSSTAPSTTASPADQLATYQADLQAVETQGLFGIGATPNLSGSLFNTIG